MPYVITVVASVVGVTLFLWSTGTYPELLTSLRHVSFNLVSIATASGFASTDFNQWPIFAPLWMLLLSCILSCAGSTGGGIKMVRTLLVYRLGVREMKRMLHPNAIWPIKLGGHAVPDSVLGSVLGFFFVYVGSIAILSLTLTASGLDFISSFSAIVACINNAGPGLNQVGPATNYQVLTDFQTWVCSFTMLLGRLELFTLLVLFTPAFWRN
jgi:trk system potassium uptake protein TrkH